MRTRTISKTGIIFGGLIFEARKKNRLTLAQLAKAAGVTPGFMSALENGSTNPSLATVTKLADILKIDLSRITDEKLLKARESYVAKRNSIKNSIVGYRRKIAEAKKELARL